MTLREAMRENVLELMEDRGLVEPKIKHEIKLDMGAVVLFCVEGQDAKRDWIVAA